MKASLRLAVLAAAGLAGLTSCDKNGQSGVLQHPPGNAALRVAVTPDKEYDQAFDASTHKLSDTTYLIITKAERGRVFAVHTGPRRVLRQHLQSRLPGVRAGVLPQRRRRGHPEQRSRLVGHTAVVYQDERIGGKRAGVVIIATTPALLPPILSNV